MMPRREFFIRALALGLVLGASVFVAVRAAVARDGVTGSARSYVTVAGTVTNLPGDPREVAMRFAFHRVGGPVMCAPVIDPVQVAPGGAFSAQVPLDAAGAVCPTEMLDGRDVEVDVDVGALSVVRNAKVNPVPYAHFATNAGNADRLTRGPRFLQSRLGAAFVFVAPDGIGGDPVVPDLAVTVPAAGTYLLVFTARCFATGVGRPTTRDDQNAIDLVVGGRRIARQALPAYMGEDTRQRVNGVTIVAPYAASAGDVVGVRLHILSGRAELSATEDDSARLIAIPMVEGP